MEQLRRSPKRKIFFFFFFSDNAVKIKIYDFYSSIVTLDLNLFSRFLINLQSTIRSIVLVDCPFSLKRGIGNFFLAGRKKYYCIVGIFSTNLYSLSR